MTTPSERLPFSLSFRTQEGETAVTDWTEEAAHFQEEEVEPALQIRENQDVAVLFQAPAGYTFTMDGMDVVSVRGAEKIGDQSFLSPSHRYVPLFSGSDFPLVPGYYVMTISAGTRHWYAALEVMPKFLEKRQWQAMRDELLEEIKDLSFDFMKRNMHISRSLADVLGMGSRLLLQFYILSDAESQVMNVLGELSRTANSRIVRRLEKVRAADAERDGGNGAVSGRYDNGAASVLVMKKEITWNVGENRFVKSILADLERDLRTFDRELEESIRRAAAEQNAQEPYRKDYQYRGREEALSRFASYRQKARRLREAIRQVTHARWYEETDATAAMPPMTVFQDPRYAVLWRLSQALKRPEDSLAVSSFYRFQWKRTDKLYELWCFLQFIKALSQDGWDMEQGPAVIREGNRYRLDQLHPGTAIVFTKGNDRIRLLYDTLIPDTAADTDRTEAPLYTNNPRRRPDCRLDYYQNGAYCGSLIADFKYRDIARIWHDEESSADVRLQFNGYRDMNTKYYGHLDEAASLRDSRPVKEVWAVFPKDAPLSADEDYSLRFISLAPGLEGNGRLKTMIQDYISLLAKTSGMK